jgi:hypothetical protein
MFLQNDGQATEVASAEPSAGRPPAWTEAAGPPPAWTAGATPNSGDCNRSRKTVHHTHAPTGGCDGYFRTMGWAAWHAAG